MAQTSFTFADITGQPPYNIGLELGIFIFITPDGRWHVRWNGNEKGQWPITFHYLWGGDITAAKIKNISSYKFDPGQPDNFSTRRQIGNDILNFNGVVFSDEDGLDFDIEADEIHFTLTGTILERGNIFLNTGLIFLGPNKINPTDTSFVITRNAPPPPVLAPTLFWADSGPADIQYALLGNTPAQLVSMPYSPCGLTLDPVGSKIYWGDAGKSINAANLDGTNVTTLVSGLSFSPYGLGLDLTNNLTYCANFRDGSICCIHLAGGQVDVLATGLIGPVDVALDLANGKIYWVEYNSGKLGCVGLDGTGLTYPLMGLTSPQGIALDAANGVLYIADKISIQRANIDGSNLTLLAALPNALGNMTSRRVALDSTASMLYFTDNATLVIQRIATSAVNGSPETVLSGLASPTLLAPPFYS